MAEQSVILVVDDNEMNRDMLSRRLKRQGYEIETAEHGQIALDMLRQKPYSLVLLDVMMPHLNGYEALEIIKADSQLMHIPVIMISAVDDLNSVVKCIEMGADDYLFKPFNPVLLKARVESSLKRAAAASLPSGLFNHLDVLEEAINRLQGHVDDEGLLDDVFARLQQLRETLT